ncbi:Glycosyl hydrolase family 26 [Natronincola peptidivorans]|uniref:Glycosyl hydrolase family 26 n=1 Tax=Natronincola peptidivorans TaxID=426128 RepID=A0A1I0CS03_9FIRM|nr:glycosyl hydrolase [Natronincola peptidivorans]SET22348.1 Glycosyl hydrolase family 26 [Natronincola peptidivorans]
MQFKRIWIFSLMLLLLFVSTMSVVSAGTYNTFIRNGRIVEDASFTSEDNIQEIRAHDAIHNWYYNHSGGYALKVWNNMNLDIKLAEVRTRFFSDDKEIEIYYDNFAGTVHSARAYINYSNRFLLNTLDHTKQHQSYIKARGMDAHILQWSRPPLEKVKDDKPYYASAEIIKNNHEVYTIIIKSATPFENQQEYMEIFRSFQLIEQKGSLHNNVVFNSTPRNINEETQRIYQHYFAPDASLTWGIFEPVAPSSFSGLHALEKRMDYDFDVIVRYHHFSDGDFPMEAMSNAYENNRLVLFTLQTMYTRGDNTGITYKILRGDYEDYFQRLAQDIKAYGHPILFRLNNEMNGDWCPYSGYFSSKDSTLYNEVWKYVYGIFEENKVDNVLWVWNPHDLSYPGFMVNHYLTYYPGDRYVDIIGLTGYNTGTYYPGEVWRGFREIYDDLYQEYAALFQQPLMITEFGASSIGGDKIAWIEEMFQYMRNYERIKIAIWWSGTDWDSDRNPARIYRLDESDAMLDAFREGFQDYK